MREALSRGMPMVACISQANGDPGDPKAKPVLMIESSEGTLPLEVKRGP